MAAGGYSYNLWTLEQIKTAIANAYGQTGIADAQCLELTQALQGLSPEATYKVAANLDNYNLVQNSLAEIYPAPVGAYSDIAHGISVNSSMLTSTETTAAEVAEVLNSNSVAAAAKTAAVQVPVDFAESQGVYTATAGPKVAEGALAGTTMPAWLGHVCTAVVGTGVGLKLGVWLDAGLYNIAPDFWDSHNLSEMNPETWSSTKIGSGLLNFADYPQTPVMMDQNGQMYCNENMFALMAQYMASQGFFNTQAASASQGDLPDEKFFDPSGLPDPVYLSPNLIICGPNQEQRFYTTSGTSQIYTYWDGQSTLYTCSKNPYVFVEEGIYNMMDNAIQVLSADGTPIYIYQVTVGIIGDNPDHINAIATDPGTNYIDTAYMILYGDRQEGEREGVNVYDDVPIGITPDMSIGDILDLLRLQFPDLFTDRLKQGVLQPDGSIVPQYYLPIGWPEGGTDTQPTSVPDNVGQVDPKNDDQTKRLPETLTPTDDTGGGPGPGGDTGTGTPPAYVPPTGSADALYKIYNPTLAQVHSLGAWLWSPNFVDQILKMFSNPMEAIISLHKVYGTPHTETNPQNIKVGYLDSGVSSKVVDQQYITIDCGTVNMREHYANILDYNPFTEVSLYLPFLGIVNLDVADVMRGKVKVIYHIDVITGAVLVEVHITRDNGAGGVIYQYTGSCAEHYPLSAGSYMGIVTGAAGIAAGVAGTVLSGGALAPMLLGGAASIGSMHTHVQKSGGFSANAGAMGIKTPYFIVSRPQSAMSQMWQKYGGMGANTYCTLGSCSGFTRVKFIHLENINGATREDLDAIELALKEGVLV